MVVVCLVEEDIFAILDLVVRSVFLEDSGGTDPVFLAELLPELCANSVKRDVLWLPH